MTKTEKITWPVARTALFWVIGLLNTVLLQPEDAGTWKEYAGLLFLLLAVIDTIYVLTLVLQQPKIEKIKLTFFKILAIILPFYFVFYPLLHEKSGNPGIRKLWKYVLAGFLIYAVGVLIYILLS